MTFASTFGAALISVFLDTGLYGVAMLLVLQYYHQSPDDHWSIRTMVGVLAVLASGQVIFKCDENYKNLIVNFGDMNALMILPWDAFVWYPLTHIIAFISQCFFVTRIWHLSPSKMLKLSFSIPIMSMSFLGLVSALVDTSLVAEDPNISHLSSRDIRALKTTFCISAVLCDVSITLSLRYLLREGRTAIQSTQKLLNTMIVQAISRGAVTSVFAILYLVLYLSKPNDQYFFLPLVPIGQVYLISVLSMLHSRTSNRKLLDGSRNLSTGISVPLATIPDETLQGSMPYKSTSVVTWEQSNHNADPHSQKAHNNENGAAKYV